MRVNEGHLSRNLCYMGMGTQENISEDENYRTVSVDLASARLKNRHTDSLHVENEDLDQPGYAK